MSTNSLRFTTLQHFLSENEIKVVMFMKVIHIRTDTAYNIYVHKKYIVHVPYEKRQYINNTKEKNPRTNHTDVVTCARQEGCVIGIRCETPVLSGPIVTAA